MKIIKVNTIAVGYEVNLVTLKIVWTNQPLHRRFPN